MGKAISRTGKTRGRPPTGAESVHLRVLPEQSARIDDWIAKQKEPGLSRPEAIRRLAELGLTVKSKGRPKSEAASQGTKQRARELAGVAIDEMTDTTASVNDQGNRRRRLIRGPEEFQSVLRDRPKK